MAQSTKYSLKNILKGKTDPQLRFGAWLWQKTSRFGPASDDPFVFFAVPLVSKRRSGDWEVVQRNLARTLASFRQQSSNAWQAVVCGQNRPEQIEFDEQVQFLPYAGSDKFYDKGDKRVALLRHIARNADRDGYYMQVDADDLLHPDFVSYVRSDNNGRGYSIDRGYMADLSAGLMAELEPGKKPFNQFCGSSSAVRVDFRPGARGSRKLLMKLKAHSKVDARMALHGMPLAKVPFHAAIYLVNHGENMQERRGQLGGKIAFLEDNAITDPAQLADIRGAFRLDDLPAA